MSTFLQLAQQLRQEVGVSGTGPSAVTNQTGQEKDIVDYIAQAELYINSLWDDWKYLWTQYTSDILVGATSPANGMPSNLGKWDEGSFWLDYSTDDNIRLEYMDYYDWRENFRQGVKSNNVPSNVVIQPDDTLVIDPPADQVYSLTGEYWRIPTIMTAGGEVSPIPANLHRIIVVRAAMMWAAHEDAPEILQSASAEYIDLLDKLEARSLPHQSNRRKARATVDMTVRPV